MLTGRAGCFEWGIVRPGDRDNELLVEVVNELQHVDHHLLVREELHAFFMFYVFPLSSLKPFLRVFQFLWVAPGVTRISHCE